MADGLPTLQMDFNEAGDPVVIVAESKEVSDPSQILTVVPELSDPKLVIAYAQLVNHLAQGDRFSVIFDPAAFEADFMSEYNAEDPDAESVQGVHRLHDFGIPDFAQITKPKVEGGALTFYAVNAYMKLPYVAVMRAGDGKPQYTPVAMKE